MPLPRKVIGFRHSHSSRRATGLQDTDYDHEINLVDHSASIELAGTSSPDSQRPGATPDPEAGPSTTRGSLPRSQTPSTSRPSSQSPPDHLTRPVDAPRASTEASENGGRTAPAVQVEEPTPLNPPADGRGSRRKRRSTIEAPESAIDILYENERGGFLCGIPLFSSKALGNLDPPAWTNYAHKPSPTNIQTAQVPDPSWEWSWPEWRINHDEGMDEGGWEYSFMFSKKFSWHKSRWWNSFVRRRAWIRKRAKKDANYERNEPQLLNAEYFSIQPTSQVGHASSRGSRTSRSLHGSKASVSVASNASMDEPMDLPDIEDMDMLLHILRTSRIDREKIEAVGNYLVHGDDLGELEKQMHVIMALFVFQASRRILVARLMHLYEETLKRQGGDDDDSKEVSRRASNLSAAIKHADEEVKRLEYWSDIKQVTEEGESRGAVEEGRGWDEGWQPGLDNSAPAEPKPGHLP